MPMFLRIALVLMLLAGPLYAATDGQAAQFTRKPTAAKAVEGVKIDFAVSAPTDVTVDVLDASGRIARHLGAAALGGKNQAPPPPFAAGLEQSIPWDGKDDAGKVAAGATGPFKARVRLGLKADFDRFIGWEDTPPFDMNMCQVNGIAVGPDRSVYVFSNEGMVGGAGRSETRIWVLSKDGKYVRTIYPYPATMDPKKLHGADLLSDAPNRIQPRVYDRVCPSYLPQMRAITRQSMAVTSDGRIVFTNGWCTELYRFGPRCLMVMNTDGSIPRDRLDGPTIGPDVTSGYTHLALAPDEKSVYYCGLNADLYGKARQNVVTRVGLGLDDKPEVVFGTLGKAASGKEGLTEPRGVATDREGRIYVSDFGNDRVVVLDPAGKFLGELEVKGPEAIAVHPKTGAVYVISAPDIWEGRAPKPGPRPQAKWRLIKLAPFKEGHPAQVAAELDLTSHGGVQDPKYAGNYEPTMSLDPYGDAPVVYIASASGWSDYKLLRIEDGGVQFKAAIIQAGSKGPIKGFPYPQGVDGEGNFYFVELDGTDPSRNIRAGWQVLAGTGELKPWAAIAGKASTGYRFEVGKDGYVYRGQWYTGADPKIETTYGLSRTDMAGKVVPFPGTGNDSEHYLGKGWRFAFLRSNLCIRPDGNIWALYGSAFDKRLNVRVAALGPDGKTKTAELVSGLQGASSLRIDSRGNIFVADGITLDGQPYPPEIDEFAKKLRAKGTTARGHHSEAVEDCYGEGYGSILKFAPEGGKLAVTTQPAEAGGTLLTAYPGKEKFATSGLKGVYPRISPMSPPRGMIFSACWCLHAVFDIDGYDRLFVPDALQFRVRVLDANFNEITSFGDYDSATAKGGKDNLPGPPIPLEFPNMVNAAGDVVYVTDSASVARRIVRVKLTYAAEGACPVPG